MIYENELNSSLLAHSAEEKEFYEKIKNRWISDGDIAGIFFIARAENDGNLKELGMKILGGIKRAFEQNKNICTLCQYTLALSEQIVNFDCGREEMNRLCPILAEYAKDGVSPMLLDAWGTAAILTDNILRSTAVYEIFSDIVETVCGSLEEMTVQDIDSACAHITHLKNIAWEYQKVNLDISNLAGIPVLFAGLYHSGLKEFMTDNTFLPSADFLTATAHIEDNPALRANHRARGLSSWILSENLYGKYGYYSLLHKYDLYPPVSPEEATFAFSRILSDGSIIMTYEPKAEGSCLTVSPKNNSFGLVINNDKYFSVKNGGVREGKKLNAEIVKNEFVGNVHILMYKSGDFKRMIISKYPHINVIIDLHHGKNIFFTPEKNGLDMHIYNQSRIVLRRGATALKLFSLGTFDGQKFNEEMLNTALAEEEKNILWSGETDGASVYTLVSDIENKIRQWHVTCDDAVIHIESPGAEEWVDIKLLKDGAEIIQQTGYKDRYFWDAEK